MAQEAVVVEMAASPKAVHPVFPRHLLADQEVVPGMPPVLIASLQETLAGQEALQAAQEVAQAVLEDLVVLAELVVLVASMAAMDMAATVLEDTDMDMEETITLVDQDCPVKQQIK